MQTYLEIQEAFTKRAETCVLTTFIHGDGTPTRGWGHTGDEVKMGQTITPEQAEYDFQHDQAKADAALHRLCKPAPFAVLDEHQKAALLDFVFNAGENHTWTIWKDVNGGKLGDVPDQFDRFIWVHPHGPSKPAVTSAGLKNRRAAEKTLWNTADLETAVVVANAGGQTVSSATRELVTPPTTTAPKTLGKTSLGLKLGAIGTSATALAGKVFTPDVKEQAQGFAGTVADHASSFGHFGTILSSVAGAGVVVIAAGMLFVHVSQQEAAKL